MTVSNAEFERILGDASCLSLYTNSIRKLQDTSGRIANTCDHAQAGFYLARVMLHADRLSDSLGQGEFLSALHEDIAAWREAGLDSSPTFDRVQASYSPPADGSFTFFVGPVLAQNGPAPRGHFLESFVALREEPKECVITAQSFPHPKNKCQSVRLVNASDGFRTGNCVVFFPENIATRNATTKQNYALFFFNKFHKIYNELTMRRLRELFGEEDTLFGKGSWISAQLDPPSCYRARCVWGYLHDYFHHIGVRPLDTNLRTKLNWYAGLLEEIKVDSQAALACLGRNVPYGKEVFEFILFERMLRYPCQPDATANFDSGSGVFLYEWLVTKAAIIPRHRGCHEIVLGRTVTALEQLVSNIEGIESHPSDHVYKSSAQDFVRGFLPLATDGTRFALPARYREQIGIDLTLPLTTFERLVY